MSATPRFKDSELVSFAMNLLKNAGLDSEPACAVARILVEADLMGHTTHGLQLLAPYLKELEAGSMTKSGQAEVQNDRGACLTWNGRRLPGPWLIEKAIDIGLERVGLYGTVTVVATRTHHTACLAAYLRRVTEQGLIILLASSDPSVRSVAPFGGFEPVYTPNPLAAGIPTGGKPILMDISMSTTAMGWVNRFKAEGRRLPGAWLLDKTGAPTDDPGVLSTSPSGTILPLGGLELGYKGFALGILMELLTSGLGGYGRADEPDHWGGSFFLQLIDPAVFGGIKAFIREADWLYAACKSVRPRPGVEEVRLPGEAALAKRETQLRLGVELHPGILPALEPWVEKLKAPRPKALAG